MKILFFSLGLKEICKDEIYQDINIIATGKLKDIFFSDQKL